MRHKRQAPLEAVGKGVVAGLVGTLGMDLIWYSRYRRGGGQDSFRDWDSSKGIASYEQAPAPAQIGKRIVEGLLQTELEPVTARAMNNAMHWLTGVGWGALYGLVGGSQKHARPAQGLALGAFVWISNYSLLVRAKLYKPMREYPVAVLWEDLSAHLAYGLATATTFSVAAR